LRPGRPDNPSAGGGGVLGGQPLFAPPLLYVIFPAGPGPYAGGGPDDFRQAVVRSLAKRGGDVRRGDVDVAGVASRRVGGIWGTVMHDGTGHKQLLDEFLLGGRSGGDRRGPRPGGVSAHSPASENAGC